MIQVTEYAQLSHKKTNQQTGSKGLENKGTLGYQQIPESTFRWLVDDIGIHKKFGAGFINTDTLKIGSYVGYVQSPDGTNIEILPKTTPDNSQNISQLRLLLQKMLTVYLRDEKIDCQQQAHLLPSNLPIHEWIFQQFLLELDSLVKRGIRFDYRKQADNSKYLRGQLNVNRQVNQPPHKLKFHINHQVFLADNIENRLIKTALANILNATNNIEIKRKAIEYSHLFNELPAINKRDLSLNPFKEWRTNRLLQHYQAIRSWCELIVLNINPSFSKGGHKGIALLFPMQYLFEDYVYHNLKQQLQGKWQLKSQLKNQYLAYGVDNKCKYFQLKPDLAILEHDGKEFVSIMDTKWKLINENATNKKFGISQSDFYQMFAYGHKYLNANGKMALIYPYHKNFSQPLQVFKLNDELELHILPFDLDEDVLLGFEDIFN